MIVSKLNNTGHSSRVVEMCKYTGETTLSNGLKSCNFHCTCDTDNPDQSKTTKLCEYFQVTVFDERKVGSYTYEPEQICDIKVTFDLRLNTW